MKSILGLVSVGLLALLSNGCASVYTNIEKVGEGEYLITKTRAGFLNAHGTLYRCTGQGASLKCTEIVDD